MAGGLRRTKPSHSHIHHARDKNQLDKCRATELGQDAMLDLFEAPPFQSWSQTSSFMTHPKKNTRRVIVNLTWTQGASVNSGIRRLYYQGNLCTYSLPNIMDGADEVAILGTGCYLWSADLA